MNQSRLGEAALDEELTAEVHGNWLIKQFWASIDVLDEDGKEAVWVREEVFSCWTIGIKGVVVVSVVSGVAVIKVRVKFELFIKCDWKFEHDWCGKLYDEEDEGGDEDDESNKSSVFEW